MKRIGYYMLSLALLSLAGPAYAQNTADKGFEKLKSLAGEWDGIKSDGQKVALSYKVISGGSAVVETLMPVNEPDMVTVYHMDGDRLMMTHYCSAGNQPRMVAEQAGRGEDRIDFELLDLTNLTDSSPGHMKHLTLKFAADGSLAQVWTFNRDGKSMPATFNFT
ncbi:MAG: hypothetical protein R3224_09255, partial [Balneolaceae bacterium]|nr:hypothetical protein [Balneolaceae bacterium]